ncbi:hypothetical protein PENSPDRAFT_574635 [Peniophora sp. CONT]|nr:hypothetical protein PENSPDRAFT_574635 [Peniophora sp. CONT]
MTSRTQIPFSDLASLPTYSSVSTKRLRSLYADISRQKSSNPSSFQSIVTWWHTTLQAILAKGWQPRSTDKLILHAEPTILPEALRYEGTGKPLGLGTVITELATAKHILPLTQFMNSAQSIYEPGWLPYRIASYVIGKPLWWALSQAGVVSSGDDESDSVRWKKVKGDYVVLALLEQAADAVTARQTDAGVNLADALYDFASFRSTFAEHALPDVTLSDADLRVLLKFLQRDRKVLVSDKEVIKFVADATDVPEVTAVDHGILELKTALGNLNAQVESLQRKIETCTAKAQAAVKNKQQEIAKTYLRSRKQLNEFLTQRLGALETLQSTLQRVEAAADNIQIMKTYESSTTTLRSLLNDPALQRESVDKTLEALADANADAKEIEDVVRVGGQVAGEAAGYEIDEDELADELERLALEEREKDELAKLEKEQKEKAHAVPERPAVPKAAEDEPAKEKGRVPVTE